MIKGLITLICIGILVSSVHAFNNKDVENVVNDFMIALNTNNAELAKTLVLPDATMSVVFEKEKELVKRDLKMSDFISDIEKRTIKVEERIWNLKINVNDNIASAWMDYDFKIEGKFSHKGSNIILLTKKNQKWLISHILFDRN